MLLSLDSGRQLSVKLLTASLQEEYGLTLNGVYTDYPVNQMYGYHSMVPSLLINQHSIERESDAKAYIARLNGILPLFQQLTVQLDKRAELGHYSA